MAKHQCMWTQLVALEEASHELNGHDLAWRLDISPCSKKHENDKYKKNSPALGRSTDHLSL